MPSSNGSSWFCDRCGNGPFREFDDAKLHEVACDPNAVRKRPRSGSPSSHSINSYYPQSQMRNDIHPSTFIQNSFVPFILVQDGTQAPDNLSRLDIATCQNVEMFQASSSDVADHDASGGMSVNPGQIGLRCIHCTKTPFAKAEYSAVFPAAIGRVAASLRMMIEVHFEKCSSLPHHTKTQIDQFKSDTARRRIEENNSGRPGEDDEWNRIAFSDFCVDICKKMSIVNRSPAQTGIVLAQQGEDVGSNLGRNSSENYGASSSGLMQPTPLAPKARRRDQQHPKAESMTPSHESQSQFVTPSMQNDPQASHRAQHMGIGRTCSSPPCLYDSPSSPLYPYYQDSMGIWVCKACNHLPLHYRSPGSLWQYQSTPTREFMERHLQQCRFYVRPAGNTNYSSHNAAQGPSSPYMSNAQIGMFGQPPITWGSPQRQQPFRNQHQPNQGAPSPPQRPPRAPTSGQYSSSQNPGVSPPMQAPNYNPYYHNSGMYMPHADGAPGQMEIPHYHGHHPDHALEPPGSGINAAIEYLSKAERELSESAETHLELVLTEDKYLLTDYFFHVIKQLRLCRFTEGDRKTRGGKRENIAIGYGGLQCVHCSESPNPRKFFWSNVDRLANSFAEIPSHVLKCRRCPDQTKVALRALKVVHPEQMSQVERGSQKIFFRRMWRRIHEKDVTAETAVAEASETSETPEQSSEKEEQKSDEITIREPDTSSAADMTPKHHELKPLDDLPTSPGDLTFGPATENSAKALSVCAKDPSAKHSTILLAILEDKEWISDMDCFVRENLAVFCASEQDVNSAQSDRKYPIVVGQVGIRCLHCAMSSTGEGARGTAVSFPHSIHGIYESVREFQRLHLESCPNLPTDVASKLSALKGSSSLSSVLRRHYVSAARALGMRDASDGNGIVAGNISSPGKGGGFVTGTPATNLLSESIRYTESSNREYLLSSSVPEIRGSRKRKMSDSAQM